jgi:hypothetical protein
MMDAPLVAGEIIGWRAWGLVTTGRREPALRSLFEGGKPVWPTKDWLRSTCRFKDPCADEEPGVGCWCGIYAARDRRQLVGLHQYGNPTRPRYTDAGGSITVVGQVALAGLIYPGSRGWRAARARPLRIFVPYAHWDLVDELARAYRVPVSLANILIEGSPGGHRA